MVKKLNKYLRTISLLIFHHLPNNLFYFVNINLQALAILWMAAWIMSAPVCKGTMEMVVHSSILATAQSHPVRMVEYATGMSHLFLLIACRWLLRLHANFYLMLILAMQVTSSHVSVHMDTMALLANTSIPVRGHPVNTILLASTSLVQSMNASVLQDTQVSSHQFRWFVCVVCSVRLMYCVSAKLCFTHTYRCLASIYFINLILKSCISIYYI